MNFEDWWKGPREVPQTEYAAREAWNAGYTAFTNELCEKCGQTRQHAGGGCIHCITEWCKDKVKEAQASAKPEIAIADAYRCGEDSRDAEIAELVAALEAIADPINYMRANLPEGARLNGAMAVQLSESPAYLQGLAKAALDKVRSTK